MKVQRQVPVDQSDNNSSYYIFAGLVFVPLSKQHINGPNAMHRRLAYNNIPKKAGDQIVIISEVCTFLFLIVKTFINMPKN